VRRVLTLKARQPLVADPLMVLAPEAVGRAEHRAIEREAAAVGVTLVRDARHLLPLPAHERVVLVNATPRASYAVLQQTRGIGPNQAVPAFDVFADRLRAVRPTIETLSHEAVAAGGLPPELNAGGTVLVVTEQYPLPGSDFDTAAQHAVVARLMALVGDRLAVIALRDPYELAQFPQVGTYLCTCSSRPCAAEAAADVVVGRRPALGRLPVSVPGAPGGDR
jgi:beta-N-acetylhexosaminidase